MNSYVYVEHSGDTLPIQCVIKHFGHGIKPFMWAQEGRYGWVPKAQIMNLVRRQKDLERQQAGYTKDRPLDFVFHWDETIQLDPVTVKLMRTTPQ